MLSTDVCRFYYGRDKVGPAFRRGSISPTLIGCNVGDLNRPLPYWLRPHMGRTSCGQALENVPYSSPARVSFYSAAQMHTRCVMASFLSNLSWHDDNKIQMYQASEEVSMY